MTIARFVLALIASLAALPALAQTRVNVVHGLAADESTRRRRPGFAITQIHGGPNRMPCARGRSVPQLIVFVCLRM